MVEYAAKSVNTVGQTYIFGTALKDHELDFKSIYHNFPSIVYVKSRRGVYKYANKAFAKFLGKNIEEIVGKTDFDLFDHQMAHEHISHDEEVYASGESKKSPFRKYRLESGEYVWLQATKTVINLNDEEEAIFGITLDVTDQKGKLEKLEKARRFESTVHRITQGIFQQENEKEICDYFIKKALLELELEDVVLYLIDENDPEKLNPVAAYHYIEKEAKIHKFIKPLHFSEGIVGRCARLRTTQLVNNTLHDPDYINDGINGKSELSVPIIVKGQVVGVLDSESMKTNSYSSFHKDIFETATSMLGVKLDQIRSLNRVKQTESYLFEILESPKSLIVFSVDVDYCYKAFNTNHKEIMKNIWGADIEIGANMLDFITKPEDKNKARLNFDKAMTGDEFTILEEYGDEERQRSYWENFYSPQYNDHKEVVGVTVFVRDVSKEMQYQQELADSQLLISSINANIRDGLFRKSLNNGFVYVNDAMTELFGMSREEFKSHSFRKLFAKAEVADHVMDQMLDFEPIKNKEALFMRRNGSQFWGLLNCISYRKNDEILIDASLVDISELKNTHSILEKKVEELKKLNEELDHLVYRTSHDLRAPVASLLGLLELLKLDQTPDPKEYMSLFNSQLGRLDHIIKDIINYRKIAKMGAKNEAIDFKTLIDQVISDNAYTEGSHRIEKVVRVQNPDNITAYLDKFSLNIILNNLISNAIKYADIDKKNPQVEVDVLIENDKVQLIVADNGIGIEKEYHDKIFDMFFRATSKKHGTGLGLFILREALLKMGGQLDFQSEPGKGSTFVLTFQNSEVE